MKAITLKQMGGIEQFHVEEVAKPGIQPNEVLIKVHAIAINPVDAFVRSNNNALQKFMRPVNGQDTFILGWDIAGIVEETGAAVTTFKKGDAVFGMVNFPGAGKAYAEYVAAPAEHLAIKPENISFEEAAAASLAALTAWQALVTHAEVKQGEKVLIHAAAGGVGHYAVQIAKHLGAYVIGTASAANKDFVLSLGANQFIDYKHQQFEDLVKDAVVVLDAVYGDHLLRSIDAAKPGGRIISLLTGFDGAIGEKAKAKNVHGYRMSVVSNGKDMQQIAALLASGAVRSHISGSFSFEDLPKAHQRQETGGHPGKIVVKV